MARALLAALTAMRGTVFLYQGDELGLPDGHVPFERLKDPFAIAAYAGGPGRDGARTPMPWTSAAPMGGFTAAPDAWLPMDPAHLPLAIERQETRDDSMLNFTRRLIAARKASRGAEDRRGAAADGAGQRARLRARRRGRAGLLLLRAGRPAGHRDPSRTRPAARRCCSRTARA